MATPIPRMYIPHMFTRNYPAMDPAYPLSETDLSHLILHGGYRRNAIIALIDVCFDIDRALVDKCNLILADTTESSYTTTDQAIARRLATTPVIDRPLAYCIDLLSRLLDTPNFFKELFAILVLFQQFEIYPLRVITEFTDQRVHRMYFPWKEDTNTTLFHDRLKTFIPSQKVQLQSVNDCVQNEYDLFLMAHSLIRA